MILRRPLDPNRRLVLSHLLVLSHPQDLNRLLVPNHLGQNRDPIVAAKPGAWGLSLTHP